MTCKTDLQQVAPEQFDAVINTVAIDDGARQGEVHPMQVGLLVGDCVGVVCECIVDDTFVFESTKCVVASPGFQHVSSHFALREATQLICGGVACSGLSVLERWGREGIPFFQEKR